jgi:hypothetical protein
MYYILPKASAKNQQSQLTNGTKDYDKKLTKYKQRSSDKQIDPR